MSRPLDLYLAMPWWCRTAFAVVCILLGITVTLLSHREHQAELRRLETSTKPEDPLKNRRRGNGFAGGIVLSGLGCVLLLTCGRTDAEKHGYHF